jgi:hypothetical protein
VTSVASPEWIGEPAGVGSFVLEPRAIPPAVRCGSCGRHHYPDQLEVRHIHTPLEQFDEGDLSLEVLCPRCHVRGILQRCDPYKDARNDLWMELMRQTSCLWCDLLHRARERVAGARPVDPTGARKVQPIGA